MTFSVKKTLFLFSISLFTVLLYIRQEQSPVLLVDDIGETVHWTKIPSVRTPDESRISASDEESAMETLVAAGLTGQGGRSLSKKAISTKEHADAMQTLVNAGMIKDADVSLLDLHDPKHVADSYDFSDGRESRKESSPCDSHPDHLDCSEYPAGLFTPQYALAKLGPDVKVIYSFIDCVADIIYQTQNAF